MEARWLESLRAAVSCVFGGGLARGIVGVGLGAWAGFAMAQETPRIRDGTVRVEGGTTVRFQFEMTSGDARAFRIESMGSLVPGSAWTLEAGAAITEAVPGQFDVAMPLRVGVNSAFYRVRFDVEVVPALVINEAMSSNSSTLPDASGAYWDWLEIHNPTDAVVDLAGYWLTDDPLQPFQWSFPAVQLQAGEYLVIFASGLDRSEAGGELHTNFRLNSGGDTLLLSTPAGGIVDQVELPALGNNESVGRTPDEPDRWVVYAKANTTPGKANAATSSGPPIPPPTFAPVEQFAAAGATLEVRLNTDVVGGVIRYTTNGSPVGATSPLYAGPIVLDATRVVRARVTLGARSSVEAFRTYFFGAQHTLPVISMATSQTNLDFKNGYLYGMNSTVVTTSGTVLQSYPYSGSNAWKDREVEAAFELFETNREPVVRQRLGVKVFGGWGSRGYPQKSLALFARDKYGDGKIRYAVFPDKPMDSYENLVLRNSGNDNQSTHQTPPRPPITQFGPTTTYGSYFVNGTFTLLRDAMMTRLVGDIDLDTQAYRPAVVYINGDYWGIYDIREKVNGNSVMANHDLEKGQVDVIEGYGSVMAGDAVAYTAMRSFVGSKDLKVAANYETVVNTQLDIDNFIDYHLAVIYDQNFDIGNIKCWRPRFPGGRFRWVLYDQDYGFGLWPADIYVPAMARDYGDYDNMFKFYTAGTGTGTGWPNEGGRTLLLRRLLLNEGFKAKFITRCADLLNSIWKEERVVATIDAMAAVIRPEIPHHLQRWSWPELVARGNGKPYQAEYAPFTQATWETHVEVMRDFARKRPAKLRLDCAKHFGLTEGTAELSVDIQPPGAGRVRVNTLVVSNTPWAGVLFRDYPVQMTAIAAPGFRFKQFKTADAESASPTLALTLPATASSVTALFEAVDETWPVVPKVYPTELQYHGATNQHGGDWVELYNPGDAPVVTTGWIFRDGSNGREFVLPASSIPAKGFLVVSQDKPAFMGQYPSVNRVVGSFGFGLGNGGDTIRLYESDGTPVFRWSYNDKAPWTSDADGTGRTLQSKAGQGYSTAAEDWVASPQVGGTPAAVNP